MKVIKVTKVIVDRIPENCWDCPFPWGGSDPGWQCSIMEMGEDPEDPKDWDIPMDGRPEWCPLTTIDEIPISSGYTILDSQGDESESEG